jgi:thioredoxin-like negative regulator of GroEL
MMDTLGWILVEQGKTARGLGLLQKAAEKAPASTEIRYHLAAALAKSGDNARAREELVDILAKDKQFPKRQEVQTLLRQLRN